MRWKLSSPQRNPTTAAWKDPSWPPKAAVIEAR
jgi:hypothetical protein